MRAAMVRHYGPPEVVEVVDLPDPKPRRGQVVVRIRTTAVTTGDARIRGAHFPPGMGTFARAAIGLTGPRRPVLGGVFSGTVSDPGRTGTATDTRVCGMTGMGMGCHAQKVAVAASSIVRVPKGVTHDQAAGVLFGGTTAWHYLHRQAHIAPGHRVLVNGASGAVGTNAVQLAHIAGADVTAVTSGANADLVRELGATRVIDYTTDPLSSLTDRYDIVFDTVGNVRPGDASRLLTETGVLLLAVAGLADMARAHGRIKAGPAPERPDDFERLLQLVAEGQLRVVVDDTFDLEDIADAYVRVDSGHKVGNVLIHP